LLELIPTAALADAQPPDFGLLTTVSSVAVIVSALLGLFALARGGSRDEAEAAAFYGLLIGAGAGLVLYVLLLIEGLL
jgi:hypothetical protein